MANEAKVKVQKELESYRAETGKKSGATVYQLAPEILFTEAAADRLQFLCEDADMAELVMAGGTLKGCVQAIVAYARRDIGNSGEITEEQFRAAIRDYYRMPEAAAEKNDPKQTAKHTTVAAKPSTDATPLATKPRTKPEPTMLSTQLDLFGMMMPEAAASTNDEEDTDE